MLTDPRHGFYSHDLVFRNCGPHGQDRHKSNIPSRIGSKSYGLQGSFDQPCPVLISFVWAKLSNNNQTTMRGMSPECIIKSLQEDSNARAEGERRVNITQQSLDSVTASILSTKTDLNRPFDDKSTARTMLQDKEKGTAKIRARLAALETRQYQFLLDLLPSLASAARQPSSPVGFAGQNPSAFVAPSARQPLATADFPVHSDPATRQPSRRHADHDDGRDTYTPWFTLIRRSRRKTRQAPPHDV